MITIKVACQTKDSAPVYTLHDFQGDLKTISEDDMDKLKSEIIHTGFGFPVLVWKDKKAKKTFIIGGHQRCRALRELKEKGWKDPNGKFEHVKIPDVPIVYIDADSMKDAKRRVLQDVAQYGKVTANGLTAYLSDSHIKLQDIVDSFRMPDLNLEFLLKAQYPEPPKSVEFNVSKDPKEAEVRPEGSNECPRCGHIWT